MLILLCNDDGIHAEGLHTLYESIKSLGRVVVVAPDQEQSASSHSITLHQPLRLKKHQQNFYSVTGTPADCITLGVHEVLKKKPDLVVSGINHGANLGYDVHYSGTVSAAMEGTIMGIKSLAFSSVFLEEKPRFKPAALFAKRLIKSLGRHELPEGVMLNVNIPNVAASQLKGPVICRLGMRHYGEVIVQKLDPRGRKYYWIGGDQKNFADIPGSDCNAVIEKKIAITPLSIQMTDFSFLEKMRNWKI
ncbi:MAG: 5'/3'-nucleotidase SurE [Deltaproteobacteria bacterium]|nr:5'/3'-nucleotidase SurE [Deltaproteobacteria bacterium]